MSRQNPPVEKRPERNKDIAADQTDLAAFLLQQAKNLHSAAPCEDGPREKTDKIDFTADFPRRVFDLATGFYHSCLGFFLNGLALFIP